ncbi:hypothetical protein [Deinococcus sonorensis]|uniref:Serine kinase n=1 Tax=Deinococcus sonorensis TaxID=309891 RepID=A0ABV8YDD9_9DEIO
MNFASLAVQVRLEGAAEGRASALQTEWQRQPVAWPTALTLTVMPGPVEPGDTGAIQLARTLHGDLPFVVSGETYRLQDGSLELQLNGQQGQLAFTPQVPPAALQLAHSEAQRAAGLLPLHAAVLTRDGRTLAITGPSGAGKSTAALRLLGRGWALVAEDHAWYHPERGEVVGWDRGLRLRRESLERFAPEPLAAGLPLDPMGKYVLDPPRHTGAVPLTRLIVLGRPLDRLGAVAAVWGMVGAPLTRAARAASQRGVERLLAQVPVEGVDRDLLVERST